MKTHTTRERLLASTMIGGAALMAFAAAPAVAQETSATQVDEIVVTGSRIVRQDYEAISPITTVTSETIEMTGTLSVESLLNELPQVVAGNMRTSNNSGGEEFATVDLRGLGPSRTLVLVNGERVPASSTTGVVDLNTIPASLIERVEVVTGGASAVYGSDAMSGVVNFILKDDFEGAELSASYGASFDGHAPEFEASLLIGGDFANGRGNLTTYASYYNRESVLQSEFDWSRVSAAVVADANGAWTLANSSAEWWDIYNAGGLGTGLSGGSATSPWGTIYNVGSNPFSPAALIANPLTAGNFAGYDHDCNPATPDIPYGTPGVSSNLSFDSTGALSPYHGSLGCAVPDRAAGSSRYNYAPDNYLIIPAERFNIVSIGHYDITDSIRLDTRLSYTNSWSQVSLAPTPATGLTVTMTPAMTAYIAANHPDLAAALASRPNPGASFTMDRRTNELGPRIGEFENNSLSMLATLSGDFGQSNWDWSLTASFGVNNATSIGRNSANRNNFNNGLAGCQDTAGNPVPDTNCVIVDIFGENTLTPAMVSYLTTPTFATTEVQESRFAGFVRGDLLELPAGPIAAVFGFEWRDSNFDFQVDNEQRSGNMYGFNAIQPQSGSITVAEFYTEVAVPLVRDAAFANYLGLEAGYRYSDYDTVGGLDTYKIGLEWEPTDWLRLRTVFNSAVRAPSVFELFQAGDQGFPSYSDPCAGALTPAEAASCTANSGGVWDFALNPIVQANSQVEAFAFGNPNLVPEEAETFTVGLVFQPDFFPIGDFRASVDYYDIEFTNIISSLGASYWIGQCYTNSDPVACARVVRDPVSGQIDYVDTTRTNSGYYSTKGYDFQIDWALDMADIGLPGRLRINELFTLVEEADFDGFDQVGLGFTQIGGAVHDWKSITTVFYDINDWTFMGRWSYLPELEDYWWSPDVAGNTQMTPSAGYLDLSARWNVTDDLQLTALIGNVFDEDVTTFPGGAYAGQANTDVQTQRVLGRTFQLSARVRF